MTNPPRRRHRPRPPIALPPIALPPEPLHEPGGNRVTIGSHTLRAAFDAHQADTHHGRIGYGCHTCHRYSQALTAARTRELETDVFDVPASAATAYAALTRPGGLPPVTISACPGPTPAAAQTATAATTEPNAPATSPHSSAPASGSAPNPAAS